LCHYLLKGIYWLGHRKQIMVDPLVAKIRFDGGSSGCIMDLIKQSCLSCVSESFEKASYRYVLYSSMRMQEGEGGREGGSIFNKKRTFV
jgi:hypothetical protein